MWPVFNHHPERHLKALLFCDKHVCLPKTGGRVLMARFSIYISRCCTDWSNDKNLKLLPIQQIFGFESEGRMVSKIS